MPRDRLTLRSRAAYTLNRWFAAKPWLIAVAVLGALMLVSAVLGVAMTVIEHLIGSARSIRGTEWHVLEFVRRTVGADSLNDSEGESLLMKIALIGISLLGVALVGTVAGSATEGIGRWMRGIQRGRMPVAETDHVIIVGWSPNTVLVVKELIEANRSEGGRPIVILADTNKDEIDQELRERVPAKSRHGTRIITRTGHCARKDDLLMVGADRARSIVLIPPDPEGVNRAVACVAAIGGCRSISGRLADRYENGRRKLTLVAPVGNESGVVTLHEIDGHHGIWVPHGDIMAKLMAHSVRQSGLAYCYEELLTFRRSELYLWPTRERRAGKRPRKNPREGQIQDVVGRTFIDIQHGYVRGCVAGIRTSSGRILLNPAPGTTINAGDQLVILAEDNTPDEIRFDPKAIPVGTPPSVRGIMHSPRDRLDVVVVGIGGITAPTLVQLDRYLGPGSRIRVLSTDSMASAGLSSLAGELRQSTLSVQHVPAISVAELRNLVQDGADAIVIFPDGPDADPMRSDLSTIHRLLQVRAVLTELKSRCRVVTEILDDRNLELADVAMPDDAVVSDRLISLYCLQLAMEPGLQPVFEDLLDSEGVEIFLHPIERYLPLGEETDFHAAIDAASRAGTTALGLRTAKAAGSRSERFGVEFNPPKARRFVPEAGDSLIVLAED